MHALYLTKFLLCPCGRDLLGQAFLGSPCDIHQVHNPWPQVVTMALPWLPCYRESLVSSLFPLSSYWFDTCHSQGLCGFFLGATADRYGISWVKVSCSASHDVQDDDPAHVGPVLHSVDLSLVATLGNRSSPFPG